MTTLEAGTAVGVSTSRRRAAPSPFAEAGHAAAGHAYLKGAESTRLSIRMRGGALGHAGAREGEERFGRFRSEEFARLVWALRRDGGGARVLRRELHRRRGRRAGDLAQAAYMVGASAMGPQPFEITPKEGEMHEEAQERILKRFEEDRPRNREPDGRRVGRSRRTRSAPCWATSTSARSIGQLVGQAYVAAHNLIVASRTRSRRSRTCSPRAARRSSATSSSSCWRAPPAHDPRGGPRRGGLVADDVMRKAASDAQPAPKGATLPARPESRADRARRLAYRGRFAAFYFLLAVVAGAGIGALVCS